PSPRDDDAARAFAAALDLRRAMALWNARAEALGGRAVRVGIGLDCGPTLLAAADAGHGPVRAARAVPRLADALAAARPPPAAPPSGRRPSCSSPPPSRPPAATAPRRRPASSATWSSRGSRRRWPPTGC